MQLVSGRDGIGTEVRLPTPALLVHPKSKQAWYFKVVLNHTDGEVVSVGIPQLRMYWNIQTVAPELQDNPIHSQMIMPQYQKVG